MAKPEKMFGAHCIKTPNGKAAALFWKDHMVFKLQGELDAEANSLDGATVFTPSDGRSMKGWTQLPFDYADRWPKYAQGAIDYVKTL